MKLSVTRCRWEIVAGLALLLGPFAAHSQGGLIPWTYNAIFGTGGYGYGSYYAPAAYYAPYGGYGYGAAYSGYGYTAAYGGYGCGCAGPSYGNYYSPSCCAPACGSSCGNCNTCGSCGDCGVSGYAVSGLCGDGCASGDCGISSGDPVTPTPYSGEPAPTMPPSTPGTAPRTYEEPGSDGFSRPQPIPGTNSPADGGGLLLPEGSGAAAPGSSTPEVAPAGGTDSNIERGDGIQFDSFKIPAKDRNEDADSKADDAAPEESRLIPPLKIDTKVAVQATPQRRRAHYRALFHTPVVARVEVPVSNGWEALDSDVHLAHSTSGEGR